MSSPNRVGKGKKGTFVQRLTAGLLVFLFLIAPIANVFAEELNAEVPTEQSTTGEEVAPTPVEPTEEVNEEAVPADENQSEEEADSNPIAPIMKQENADSSFKLNKQILPETDLSTGALTYNFPLSVPTGRASMTPDISLTYNSQNTDQQNIIGYGWSLSIPSITRANKTGVEKMYSDNFFSSSLDGELIATTGNHFGAKIENGSFLNYVYEDGYWKVTDKQGTVYTFGETTQARQQNSNGSKVYKWLLEEVRDTNNNFISYSYSRDEEQMYPETITYTGFGETPGAFKVEFSKIPRNDALVSYSTGFLVKTNFIINSITTKINNEWLRKYDLNYVSGDNGIKSMLGSITESGRDEQNNVDALPATQFSYQKSSTTPGWDLSTGWSFPSHPVGGVPNQDSMDFVDHRTDAGVRMFDANKDGLMDLIQSGDWNNQSTSRGISMNNSDNTGWTLNSSWSIDPKFAEFNAANQPWDAGLRVADVNGDSLPDLVKGYNGTNQVYIHTGSGWTVDSNWIQPVSFVVNTFKDNGVRIGDVNGDGLPDLLEFRAANSNDPAVEKVYINNGNNTGWAQDTNWQIPICNRNTQLPNMKPYFTDFLGHDAGVMLMDINSDGLLDLVQNGNTYSGWVQGVSINKGDGTGWACNSAWNAPGERGARFADVNGDGFMDEVDAYEEQFGSTRIVRLNNGLETIQWTNNTAWNMPINFIGQNGNDQGTRLEDVNGDGMADLVQAINDTFINFHRVYLNNNQPSDLLKTITVPTGASTSITYKASPQYRLGGQQLNNELPVIIQTVNTITTTDTVFDTENTITYSYQNGSYYYDNPRDRKFSGFGKVTVTDDDGNTTTTSFHGGTQNEPQFGQYDDHISKMGKPYRVEIKNANGNLYSKNINKWEKVDLGNGRNFVKQTRAINFSYDGNSTHKDKAEIYTYDDSNGNKVQVENRGEVMANDDGSLVDNMFNDVLVTSITYTNNTSNGIIGLPVTEVTKDINEVKVNETKHYYDNLALGQVGAGNETKTEMWRVGSKYIDVEKTYNSYGLVSSEKDPRDKETSYVYDSYNLFPISVTNPLSQVTSYTYDYSSGQVKTTTDPNGRVFTTIYDGLDRVIEEKQPDAASPSTSVTSVAYEYIDTVNAFRIKKSVYLSASNIIDSYTYFDGLGRKIQEREEAETSGLFNVRDFVYADDGLLLKESLPYISSGTTRTTANTENKLFTRYTYDTLKRVLTATVATNWVTTNTYDDWKTTVTDSTGKVKDLYRDAYDNLIAVGEHNGSAIYTTTYNWNGQKKLTKITDALANIRNFTYDGLGRVLSAEDLHASTDTTFGVWNYSYDDASNLSSRLDPNGVTVVFNYDDLNRPLTEDAYNDQVFEVINGYDNCDDGIGRLCTTLTTALGVDYDYNALGQIVVEEKMIDRGAYRSEYSYDRQGNKTFITNPDNSQIKYFYNAAGLVNEIEHKESSDPGFTDIISSIDYNSVALPTSVTYANGAVTTNSYDADELYRLRTKITVANGQNVQDLNYAYDAVGNITQIVDASVTLTAKTTDYTYDDLHRLLSSTITNSVAENVDGPGDGNQTQTFTYDAIGNILSKSDVGNYSYEGDQGNSYANPHAVTSAGGTSYSYDNNGNLTGSGFLTSYTWDYNNRLTEVSSGLVPISYEYDASGQRIKSIDSAGTTLSITNEYSITPNGTEKHIFLGDTAIASISNSSEVYNIHADHLTGSNVITDHDEQVDELTDYYAFGTMRIDEQNGSHAEKRKFTGHEYDADTGLNYMSQRYYEPTLGRFLSQDQPFLNITDAQKIEADTQSPYVEYLGNPQNQNSYSYVYNNPLKYKDINGKAGVPPWVLWTGTKIAANLGWNFVKSEAQKANDAINKAANNSGAQMVAGGLFMLGSIIQANPGGVEEGAARVGTAAPRIAGQAVQARMLAAQRLQNLESSSNKAKAILDSFSKQTFDNKYKSIVYHVNQHGDGLSVYEYTQKALQFFVDNAHRAQILVDRTGKEALKIPGRQNGGWYTKAGEIITHWFE